MAVLPFVPASNLGTIRSKPRRWRTSLFGAIADKHPQLTLILDHTGVTAAMVKDGKLDDGIAETVALAKYPNVGVKVSASPGLSREPYPFRDVAGHINRVFEAYGPQRSYWGTDLTNSYAKASYRQRISHFTEGLSFSARATRTG
jgi:predicted TIM-barrel fold metal-dependent hydrolase